MLLRTSYGEYTAMKMLDWAKLLGFDTVGHVTSRMRLPARESVRK